MRYIKKKLLKYCKKYHLDINIIREEFKNKYGYEILIPNLLREITKDDYKHNWENRLVHQIFDLPDFNTVIKDLDKLIKNKLNY